MNATVESTGALAPLDPGIARSKGIVIGLKVGDGPEAWGFAAATGVLWGLSYFFWRRLEAMTASA